MEELNGKNNDLVLRRVAKRSAIGALVGMIIGMAWNAPFKGITTTSNDVQGLTYFSWFMVAGVGMILGIFAGLIGRNQHQELNGAAREPLAGAKPQKI